MRNPQQNVGIAPNSGRCRGVDSAATIGDPDALKFVIATHNRATRRAAKRNLAKLEKRVLSK